MTTAGRSDISESPWVYVALIPSTLAGLVCVVVGVWAGGASTVLGAAIGTAVAVGFFWTGQAILRAVSSVSPSLFLVVALLTYLLQVVSLLAVFASFRSGEGWSQFVSGTALGITIMVCTVVWTVGLVVDASRSRAPLYDLGGQA